jgi:hypothetical protein
MKYTIVLLANATPQWMSLSREDRDQFVETEIRAILEKFKSSCRVRLFDSDFTHATVSDFMIIETDDLMAFGYLMGYLRESKTFAAPFFTVRELVVGVDNNFRGSINIGEVVAA